jgi:hypothetical protein
VQYTFTNDDGSKEKVVITAKEIEAEADIIAGKLTGLDEETTKKEQHRRELIQESIADCTAKLKVDRKYEGPVNVEDCAIVVREGLAQERVAA